MDSAGGPWGIPLIWLGAVLLVGAAVAGAVIYWQRRGQRRRVAHYLFTPLPCTFDPARFEASKSLFDVVWDIGLSDTALELLHELQLLPRAGRLDYAALNRTLDSYVDQLGSYRNFVYECQSQLRKYPHLLTWNRDGFAAPDGALTNYVEEEDARLDRYHADPTKPLQNRMAAYLYDDAKTALARKYGLALAFDYQSFQLLKRCNARSVQETHDLLTYTDVGAHDREQFWTKVKAASSAGSVALLEVAKGGTAVAGDAAATAASAGLADAAAGAAAEAAAGAAAEGGAAIATEVAGALALSRIAGQFVPIVQAVVLAYGAVQAGRYVWRRSQRSNTWLRERRLRNLQTALSERLDAMYARYEELRDTMNQNMTPFAPAHELLALCEFEEQRLATIADQMPARTGGGDLGLLRAHLGRHAVDVSAGLSKGLAVYLKALIRDTDAQLASGNKADAALHLFLNKDLVFVPQVLDEIEAQEIAMLAADVSAEVARLNAQ